VSTLLISPEGMLGRAFVELLTARGEVFETASYPSLDVTQPATLRASIHGGIDRVINCAAFTDVDGAESREAEALAVNGQGVMHLAQACALVGACVVYGLASEVGALAATGLLFVATVLLTVGELWISASEWSLRFGLAPDDRQGEYGGVFALGRSGSDLAGPVTAVGVTDAAGLLGWLGLAGGFLVIGAVTVPIVAWAARSRQRAEPPG